MKINLRSSGSFLNIKKPQLISMDKYNCKIKKIKLKKEILNISTNDQHVDSIIQNGTNSKDEIINILKERISILEKKVQFLENENINNNNNKSNFFNLSHSNTPKKFQNFNLNIKYFKNKPNFLNIFAPMKSYKRRSKTNFNNHTIKNNYNINNIHISTNTNKPKNKYSTVIPKILKQKVLLINSKKRSLTKSSTVENKKFSTIERSNSNDNIITKNNNNIPKIPKRKLFKLKSALINNIDEKKLIRDYSCKNSIPNMSNNNSNRSIIDSDDQKIKNTSFSVVKNKMENIKKRTEKLLRFYANNYKNN